MMGTFRDSVALFPRRLAWLADDHEEYPGISDSAWRRVGWLNLELGRLNAWLRTRARRGSMAEYFRDFPTSTANRRRLLQGHFDYARFGWRGILRRAGA